MPRPFRSRPTPFTGTIVDPGRSPLPRFAAPADESPDLGEIRSRPLDHAVELRPKGERLLVHCFPGDSARSLAVAIHPADPALAKARVSLSQSIVDALAVLADLAGAVVEGSILDATLVVRPGFRVIGPTGAPLANQLVVSDLPYLGGELIIGRPYGERREMLATLIEGLNQPSLVGLTDLRPVEGAQAPIAAPRGMLLVVRSLHAGYTPRQVAR
jgi:hypothetical protein